MELSEAYNILGLAPGAGEEEIRDAFRKTTLSNLPDRIQPRCLDTEDRESRIEYAIENMKATNKAREVLMKAVIKQPETEREAVLTKNNDGKDQYEPISEFDGTYSPRTHAFEAGKFSTLKLPNIGMAPRGSTDTDEGIPRELPRFEMGESIGGQRLGAHSPTEDEYCRILQDLATLHQTLCDTADTIETMSHTLPNEKLWNHLWLTLHLAGATTEEAFDIVRYSWLKTLRKGAKLGPGEWDRLEKFIITGRKAIADCDRILADWNPQRECPSCLELYSALRKFPIAKGKCDESWQSQDQIMCAPAYGRFNPGVKWIFNLFEGSV